MDEVQGCVCLGAKCIIWHHKVWVLLQLFRGCDGDQEAVQLPPLTPHTYVCQNTSVHLYLKVHLNDVINISGDNIKSLILHLICHGSPLSKLQGIGISVWRKLCPILLARPNIDEQQYLHHTHHPGVSDRAIVCLENTESATTI